MSGLDLLLGQDTLWRMLFVAALTGFGLGVVYDAISILRLVLGDRTISGVRYGDIPPHDPVPVKILRFVLDAVFAILVAVAFTLLCYYTSDGQLRAPAILGSAGGFFVWRKTLSPLVLRLAVCLLRLFCRLVMAVLRLLLAPLVAVGKRLGHMACRLFEITVGRFLCYRRRRITENRLHVLCSEASQGFGLAESRNIPPNDV